MKRNLGWGVALLVIVSFGALAAAGLKTYKAPEHGFEMLVPTGTELSEKEWDDGWAGLHGEHEDVHFAGIAKKGIYTSAQIAKFAVAVTGVEAKGWKKIDSGKGGGWTWYEVYYAVDDDDVVIGSMGVGNGYSYLLFLKTTLKDYNAHKADYHKWYKSVRIQKPVEKKKDKDDD